MATGGRAVQKSDTKKRPAEILPLEYRIRLRAHEIWLQRGGKDGSDLDDWLQAEQEILGTGLGRTARS